jgi:hypothetical protein
VGKPALDQRASPARGDIRLPGAMATDVAPLGLDSRPRAITSSHGSEAIAVGHRMAPAEAGSGTVGGELNLAPIRPSAWAVIGRPLLGLTEPHSLLLTVNLE